ncbi:HTH_Tnp_Tc3_2 domain-containing protein [Trichonephila clavipes]|nr:HTH_Tnp_Tc3_2 domain-containing protein [Trichonephila clavipes]
MQMISSPTHSDKAGADSDIYNFIVSLNFGTRVSRDRITFNRIWNRWDQNGNTEGQAGSQRPPITSSREDRHIIRMALMDRAATIRALIQEMGSFVIQVSARTVR